MSGFPLRFFRAILGPKFRNSNPVENPETDIDAAAFEAAFQQIVGANLIVPRVSLIASWNGASFDFTKRNEAWNTDGAQAHPVLARSATGRYNYTFAAQYLDENGALQNTVLLGARATSRKLLTAAADRVDGYAWIDVAFPLVVQLGFYRKSTDAAEDVPFWLEVD